MVSPAASCLSMLDVPGQYLTAAMQGCIPDMSHPCKGGHFSQELFGNGTKQCSQALKPKSPPLLNTRGTKHGLGLHQLILSQKSPGHNLGFRMGKEGFPKGCLHVASLLWLAGWMRAALHQSAPASPSNNLRRVSSARSVSVSNFKSAFGIS